VVARRLDAVLRWTGEAGIGFARAGDAISAAGVSKPRFYAMVADWRAQRSIAAFGARASEKMTREPRIDVEVRAAALRIIRQALDEDPGASLVSMTDRLAAAGLRVSRTMARRLLLEIRRNAAPGPFGGELVFDSVGLDAQSDGERMRLYVVIDRGTGLVIGWAEATNRSRAWGHVHAAEHAAAELVGYDLSAFDASDTGPSAVLVLQPDDEVGGEIISRRLIEAGVPHQVTSDAPGRIAAEILGERLGPVWLGVGHREDDVSYRHGRRMRMPEYTGEMMSTLSVAIGQHNAARRAALGAVLEGRGSIAEAKDAVTRVLALVADAAGQLEKIESYSEASMFPGL
jgi:hypothetical protein